MLSCLGEEKDNTVLLFILSALLFLDPRREVEIVETTCLPDHFSDTPPRMRARNTGIYSVLFFLLGIYWMGEGWWYKCGV